MKARFIHNNHLLFLLMVGLLTACASHVPEHIRTKPTVNITPKQVQKSPETFKGQTIRWGGTIIKIKNLKAETHLTILAQSLGSYGEPVGEDQSHGRFIAIVPFFLDPAIYAKERVITIFGEISAVETKKIDDFVYDYPVVKVKQHYLWQPRREIDEDFYPWFWHDPWYPYYHPHTHY